MEEEKKVDRAEELIDRLSQSTCAKNIHDRLKAERDENKAGKDENATKNSSIKAANFKKIKIKEKDLIYKSPEKESNYKVFAYLFAFIALALSLSTVFYFFESKKVNIIEKIITKEVVKKVEIPKEVVKKVEVVKEVTKLENFTRDSFKKYFNNMKTESVKCYDFVPGKTQATAQCKKKINVFLKKHHKALRFEIIPVIGKGDNTIYTMLSKKLDLSKIDKATVKKVEKYMYRGLARDRITETTWYIKDILEKPGVITTSNYFATSKQENRGIIIKAYH